MKISIRLSRTERLGEVVQALSALRLTRKDQVDIVPAGGLQISLPRPAVTKTRYRDFHVICQVDNTLRCRENGQTIPSTREGAIDKEKLVQEILAGKWIPFGKQCQQP